MKTLLTLVFALILVSFVSVERLQDDAWIIPEAAKKMKNPVKSDSEGLVVGKNLYAKHCKSCHGKEGVGDGPKSEELDTFPGDFTMSEFQAQTDGTIFFKTKEGRGDMPSFSKKLAEDEDIWLLVNYIRTLKN